MFSEKLKTPAAFAQLNNVKFSKSIGLLLIVIVITSLLLVGTGATAYWGFQQKAQLKQLEQVHDRLKSDLARNSQELDELKSVDQYKRNEELQLTIAQIEQTYKDSIEVYEKIQEMEAQKLSTETITKKFLTVLDLLSKQDYQNAQQTLSGIEEEIAEIETEAAQKEAQRIAQEQIAQPTSLDTVTTVAVSTNNTPPSSGFSSQRVSALDTTYTVSLVAGDLGSTKVLVDTASAQDCANDCPVLSLADYVSRNGAYAGINGTYFCPATYPSCAGKTNSFDLLVMNKDKTYFNSSNNVYSTNPGVVFGDGYIRFLGSVSEWGRDTSPYGVLSNYPLLISGGSIRYTGGSDPKHGSKGARSFVANKGNTVFIGVVHNSTVAEAAAALHALGMENALNLDSGGSTALWFGGYKAGPGRNIPNAILFVRK